MKQTAPLKNRDNEPKCIHCEKNVAKHPNYNPCFCSSECAIQYAYETTKGFEWEFDPDFGEYVWKETIETQNAQFKGEYQLTKKGLVIREVCTEEFVISGVTIPLSKLDEFFTFLEIQHIEAVFNTYFRVLFKNGSDIVGFQHILKNNRFMLV